MTIYDLAHTIPNDNPNKELLLLLQLLEEAHKLKADVEALCGDD